MLSNAFLEYNLESFMFVTKALLRWKPQKSKPVLFVDKVSWAGLYIKMEAQNQTPNPIWVNTQRLHEPKSSAYSG